MLQCVVVCCSVSVSALQCFAVCFAECCSEVQKKCVREGCVWDREMDDVIDKVLEYHGCVRQRVWHCVAVCCSLLHCVAVRFSRSVFVSATRGSGNQVR